ncbi:hypothetical protein BDA96_04G039100, partial [Sorghum bicolor]
VGSKLENIGKFWFSNKKHGVLNMVTSAALWCIWKLRNDLCFQRTRWKGMDLDLLFLKVVAMVQNWLILCQAEEKDSLLKKIKDIKNLADLVLWLQN